MTRPAKRKVPSDAVPMTVSYDLESMKVAPAPIDPHRELCRKMMGLVDRWRTMANWMSDVCLPQDAKIHANIMLETMRSCSSDVQELVPQELQ